ncbi:MULTISPECIES: choloylglycine hydrolase family protein [unclassified Moorena]|uniref:choloylglycine hydrolase family protein n=1 Tax=unclassified Moorena TaxID=2683338 RepID=UPI0013CD95C6|nr:MULTISPECIES: choloylglycine hydrolase family protein [unclassified Moorena]NEO22019.1 choloylglycine hydrolase family protein [Moorena sp. SIO4A5]NEP22143.1 choloylglycine hydrolase family protein [Moorena sp. SIO3I6]NEQ60855.1 choloylglycine hydrolase family protein [Moorena sp. SIO4A1]
MKNIKSRVLTLALAFMFCLISLMPVAYACTGITLTAEDGAMVYGRTLEWGVFDIESRILILPRGHEFVTELSNDKNVHLPGIQWTGKYGVVGIDGLNQPIVFDGMNEKGLTAGVFYHPGFAEYIDYDSIIADKSMAPTDVANYLLSTCATLDDVRQAINQIVVVNVVEPALEIPAPIHLMVSDPSGEQIVIEWLQGKPQIFDAELGVITNAPTYDWHITNLRNYVNLSAVALPDQEIGSINFSPLGSGSGMIGLPGDFTPPSRLIRAVAFTQTARPTSDGLETMYELFRILDNFNVPLGASEGSEGEDLDKSGMRSSTLWTTAQDLTNKVTYYHTQHNRQVRKIDVGSLDFETISDVQTFPLDLQKEQNIEDRTPGKESVSS